MHFPSAAGYGVLDHGEQQNTESREQYLKSYVGAYDVSSIVTTKWRLPWSEKYLIIA